MASHSNFQVQRNKATKGNNIFKKGRSHRKTQTKSERLMDGVGIWTSYYRANPHRFVRDYLGIELKLFQQILLFAMMHFTYLTYIAARGQGKTFLTAIFCITRSILYPETKIVAAAGIKSQSREVVEKIEDLRRNHPNLAREIADLKTSVNDAGVQFHNGSWIKTVASNDGARGKRSNLLIIDEFRLVEESIINSVLRKFQTAPRQPKYLNKPEYAHLQERNKEIYLSSAWYKSHHSWDKFMSYFTAMAAGKSYFVCGLPYQISIKEGLLMEGQVQDEMSESNFDPISWNIEMECMFFGQSEKAFFKFEDIQKNRKLAKVYYPKEVTDLLNDKSILPPKKAKDEIRLVSADIATMKGIQNDASAFFVARLVPTKDGYDRQIIYSETIEGGHTGVQAMRIRQLFYDFNCDYIVLDTLNAGIGIYDQLTETQNDSERGTEYEPLSCINDERLAERCVYPNAPKVVYSIRGNATLNSQIANSIKDVLKRQKMKLPVPEAEGEEFLKGIKGYEKLPEEQKEKFRMPYMQTTLLINEMMNLEMEINETNGLIKLKEQGRSRKDRYSALSYLNYIASELEIKSRKKAGSYKASDYLFFKQSKYYS